MTDYQQLLLQLIGHCYLYYDQDDTAWTDAQYDQGYQRLQAMEREQGFAHPSSPTMNVGFNKEMFKGFLIAPGREGPLDG